MYEKKKINIRDTIILLFVACLVALIAGLSFRPLVSKASDQEHIATSSDTPVVVSTSSDAGSVDRSPYLTNDVVLLQTNDLLLSIRNILVCIWGSMIVFWTYARMKAIICRLGGYNKNV